MNISADIRDILEMRHNESIKIRFTRVQNNILDNMPAKLPASDRAILDAVIRKTNGYNYATCKLSFKKLANLSGYNQRTVKTSVRKLCAIGILCVLPKNKKNDINEYYIDPYWNTDKSIKKQLDGLLEEKEKPSSGPCPIQEFDFIANKDLPSDEENNEAIDNKTESGVDDSPEKICTDYKATDINPEDTESKNQIDAKAFVKGLISTISDDTTRHLCSDHFSTTLLNSNDFNININLKKQTDVPDEKKADVCFSASIQTGMKRSKIDYYMGKYGFEYFSEKLEIFKDFKIDHVLSNPAGYFTKAIEENYQSSKRLRDKWNAKKRSEKQELEQREKSLREKEEKLQEDLRAQILTQKKSNLSDCEYSELKEKAKQMLVNQGANPYFILSNAIESQINLILLND